jgi:FAD/FMN-containing dehydrogenase
LKLFDRYGKLRESVRDGRLHTEPKDILSFLKGRLGKTDLPAVVIEPANESELRAALMFAAEKKLKVALASGLKPVEVRDLAGHMLVLTTRLTGSPVISSSRRSIRVDAGLPMESLAVDLSRSGLRWHPLLPVPSQTSAGELYAQGWEGLRNWKDGVTLSHVRAVEWMGYDGRLFETSPVSGDGAPDVSGFLFGSRGAMGVITALELDLQPAPSHRVAVLFELPEARAAYELLADLREGESQPETVVYWGEAATQILREGTDNRVSPAATVMLAVEWSDQDVAWKSAWNGYGEPLIEENSIAALWQDLFRFPRTAARLYPERTGARLSVPAEAVPEMEEAVRELGHDFNFRVALWGTVEAGHVHAWILQPDGQPRTTRRAEELLKKLVEFTLNLGGRVALGCELPFDFKPPQTSVTPNPFESLRAEMQTRCDPNGMFVPLCKG